MKKFFKILLISLSAMLLLSIITAAVTVAVVVTDKEYVKLDYDKLTTVNCALTILDKDGVPLEEPMELDSAKVISLSGLSEDTVNCFISIEDKRFYSHNGIDIRSIFRALLENLGKGSFSQGASTITQQLIKNTHLSNKKELKRKINEILLSFQVEKAFTKQEILQMYLNTIYFGGNCYGIESAANAYFGKSAAELTLSESAYLAGMIKAPNHYSPHTHLEEGLKRRNVVLKTLVDNGFITQERYDKAAAESIILQGINSAKGLHRSYTYAVIAEACEILNTTPLQLLNSSLVIQTYCDPAAQRTVKARIIEDGSLCVEGDTPQKSAILIDNESGGVVAYYSVSPYDALRQGRQIGSAAKPIAVYGPAIELNYITQLSPILDEKVSYGGYTPSNYNDNYFGWVTAKEALSRSLNASAVKIINGIGADKAREYLSLNGISTQEEDENLTLALGCIKNGTDIQRLARAYLTFTQEGTYKQGGFVKSISNDKSVLYSQKGSERRVFGKDTCFIMTDMLLNAAKNGTARKLGSLPFETAAKTGTVGGSEDNSDAIVCGYTSRHTFVVWLSENKSKLKDITGSGAPCEIARDILKDLYADSRPGNFAMPQSVVKIAIDKDALINKHKVAQASQSARAEKIIYGYFSKDNMPKSEQIKNYVLFADINKGAVHLWTSEEIAPLTLIKMQGEKTERLTEDFRGEYFDILSIKEEGEATYYLCENTEGEDYIMSNQISLSFEKGGSVDSEGKNPSHNGQNPDKDKNKDKSDKKKGFLDDILKNWNLQ